MAQKKHESRKQDSRALARQGSEFADILSANPIFAERKLGSVDELVAEYKKHDAAIKAKAPTYLETVAVCISELSEMQSILSKQGVNHDLVIEARKQGHNIPWWTDYYATWDGTLFGSQRNVMRHIAICRNGGKQVHAKKKDKPATPHLNAAGTRAAVKSMTLVGEIATAHEADRPIPANLLDETVKLAKQNRKDDILTAAMAAPDYEKNWQDTLRGLRLLLDAFEKQDIAKTLPAELRKLVRETRKEFFPVTAKAVQAKPAVGELPPANTQQGDGAPTPAKDTSILVKLTPQLT